MSDEAVNRHILQSLDRLTETNERLAEKLSDALVDITEIRSKLNQIEPAKIVALEVELNNLKSTSTDREERIRKLETAESKLSGKWGIIAVIASAVLASAINILFAPAKAAKASTEKPPITRVIQQDTTHSSHR